MNFLVNKIPFYFRLRDSSKAFLMHFLISGLIGLAFAVFFFEKWYPYPYDSLVGGRRLLGITAVTGFVTGPLLTLIIFSAEKKRREIIMDMTIVALIQGLFISYGFYVIAISRPVILAYEKDRFVVVTYGEIDQSEIIKAFPEYQEFSWSGPKLVGIREAKDKYEEIESINLSMQGKEPSLRPQWWQNYDNNVQEVASRMKKLSNLHDRASVTEKNIIESSVNKTGIPINSIFYLPLTSNKNLDDWVLLLNKNALIIGFIPVNGFDD